MIRTYTFTISFLFFVFFSDSVFSQKINLKLSSKTALEKEVLANIKYQKIIKDSIYLKLEIDKISEHLKNLGYFTNTLDSLRKTNKTWIAYFSLNTKVDAAIIEIPTNSKDTFNGIEIKKNKIKIPIKELRTTLTIISKNLDKQGKSFSKVQLRNIQIKGTSLFAELEIQQSKKRIINEVIVKGYKNFPKSYLKNYFKINKNTVFNQKKIKGISENSKNLNFVEEIKKPEVLFTKDSTLLYIYLKKIKNNSFDGIVNFISKQNGGIQFNGNIDLKLNNILERGEKFDLFWNSIGNERQEFKISVETPYIFNTAITPEFSFSLYKQDSTYLNSKFDSKIKYSINNNLKIGVSYSSESSENLISKNTQNNIKTFKSDFIGTTLTYSIPKKDGFMNDKINIALNPFLGKRKTKEGSVNQFKVKTTISYIWDINNRNSVFIRNETGYLNSDTYLNNELFRIGGANSIRGFNEQSIFTRSFTFFNIEYRYLTSKKSYLYTITDIAKINISGTHKNLFGLGLGYEFMTNNSKIRLSTVVGKSDSQNFNFAKSKLIISWKSYF